LRAAFFALDNDLPHLIGLEARIAAAITPAITDLGYELVRLAVLGRERPTVQIMADRTDGTLIGVDDCVAISHAVSAVLDVDDPIPGEWNLEVSSAGIDRPLTREKDWVRFAGHLAKAELNIPVDGRKRFAGIVLGAQDGYGRMRLDDGSEVKLPLMEMRKARLVLTDALVAASALMMNVKPSEDETETEADASAVQAGDTAGSAAGIKPGQKRKPNNKTH